MPEAACSDEEFISLFEQYGPSKLAQLLNVTVRNIYKRRTALETRIGREIKTPDSSINGTRLCSGYPKRMVLEIKNGVILVGSDAHWGPDHVPTATRAFVKFCQKFKGDLKAIILNGDIVDGGTTGRHDRIMWSNKVSCADEIDAVEEITDEIRAAAKGAELIWTLGNHDQRFESYLAKNASEMERVKGVRLADHFPHWQIVWSLWINDEIVIKHRFKGGVHATHNNTLHAGKTMVTGHLHSLKVVAFDDYNGTRFGVDTGTLNEPNGEHADYDEDNPKNHRSGFIVLTIRNSKLLWPEIVAVVDENHVQFRGEIIKV